MFEDIQIHKDVNLRKKSFWAAISDGMPLMTTWMLEFSFDTCSLISCEFGTISAILEDPDPRTS